MKLRGTSISDYRDTVGKPGAYAKQRFVYRREGELCRRCKIIIKRVKIGGRSACFFVLNAKNCKKYIFVVGGVMSGVGKGVAAFQ